MEDMEKRTEEIMEVEMNQRMTERVNWIDTQTYWYLLQLLNLNEDEAEKKFPWDIQIIREAFDDVAAVLDKYGHKICDPYISTPEVGRQYRCTLSECGCKSCGCQDELMEKERLLSGIEEAVALTGLKIVSTGKDSIIVREGSIDTDFEIRVSQITG